MTRDQIIRRADHFEVRDFPDDMPWIRRNFSDACRMAERESGRLVYAVIETGPSAGEYYMGASQ